MNALQKWAEENNHRRGSGSAGLARYLGITKSAAYKIVYEGSHYNMKYAKEIMLFTGLKAEDLFPEWFEIILASKQQQDVQKRIKKLQNKVDSLK